MRRKRAFEGVEVPAPVSLRRSANVPYSPPQSKSDVIFESSLLFTVRADEEEASSPSMNSEEAASTEGSISSSSSSSSSLSSSPGSRGLSSPSIGMNDIPSCVARRL